MIDPLVTIVTATYNDARYIHQPIDSVLSQPYDNFEMIIVNDGTTDEESLKILDKISHPKIRIIHQNNKGLAAARNTGIRAAKGKYILPLDADDYIARECLERSVAELEAHPEAVLVYGNYKLFGRDDRILHTGQFNTYRILFNNYLPVCSLYRRSAWEEVGGYTDEMLGFEDWEFWIKLVERGFVFRKIEDVLYFHHVHDGNMWIRDKGKWRAIVNQIRSFHPLLYTPANIARLRRENKVTWLEDIVYRLPPPLRYELRTRVSRTLVPVARAMRLYRDQ